MDLLSPLERAVLRAIAAQVGENGAVLNRQTDIARVASRENTGAGFFTTFNVSSDQRLDGIRSPLGDIGASVEGLRHGMSFLLWIKDGFIHQLEGYANGSEDTSRLEFEHIEFHNVVPR